MNAVDFSQLASMLQPHKVAIKMSYHTHKYILGIGGSIANPQQAWTDEEIPNLFQGINVIHENIASLKILLISTAPYIRKEIAILID